MLADMEPLTGSLLDELAPMFVSHHAEIRCPWPLDVDYGKLIAGYKLGILRAFVLRDEDGAPLGYALYTVSGLPFSVGTRHAVEEALYVDPSARGGAGGYPTLSRVASAWLKSEGVAWVHRHAPVGSRYERIVESAGSARAYTVFLEKV